LDSIIKKTLNIHIYTLFVLLFEDEEIQWLEYVRFV